MIFTVIDFFRRNKKITVGAVCALSAAVSAFCLMFSALSPLQWISLVPAALCLFLMLEKEVRPRRAYLYGVGFFWVYYLVLFYWFVYMYPLDFLKMGGFESVVVIAVSWLGVSFGQAAFSALAVPIVVVLAKKSTRLVSLLCACLWVVFEWGLTLTRAGVPWSRLAIGQIDMPMVVQSASLFGSYFITFLIVLVNFLIAYTVRYKRKLAAAVAMLLFSANLALGGLLLAGYEEGEKITVSAVQGNIPSKVKWNESLFVSSFRIYSGYVERAAQEGAQVVLLPETVVPFSMTKDGEVAKLLSQLAEENRICLLVGGFYEENGKDYNSIFAFHPDGRVNETVYRKRHLVPFGEYIPLGGVIGKIIPPLADVNAYSQDISAGDAVNIIDTEYGRMGCLVCFDSVYERAARESVRGGAQILMLATNDSWFSDSVALDMHNNQARLRAIETRRSVVRAANTGISSVITPSGEVVDSIGALKRGFIVEDAEMRSELTLYTRIGDLFVLLCGAFVFSVMLLRLKSACHWRNSRKFIK